MNNDRHRIIWLTGPHAPEKAKLAESMRSICRNRDMPAIIVGDGQVLPCVEQGQEASVRELHQRLCRLVVTLAEQGHSVIVNSGPIIPDASDWNRDNLPGYYEVDTSAAMESAKTADLQLAMPLSKVEVQMLAEDIVEDVFGRGGLLPGQRQSSRLPDPGPAVTARAV